MRIGNVREVYRFIVVALVSAATAGGCSGTDAGGPDGSSADTTMPTIVSTAPGDGAVEVSLNGKIAATFSEAMLPGSITAATFRLDTGGTPVAGTTAVYAEVGKTAQLTPAANLAANTIYNATITVRAVDLANNPLAADFTWSFKTGMATDVVAPTVKSTNPASAAVNVFVNQSVNATFSEALDASTITALTMTLSGPGGVAVAGAVSYDAINHIATLKPNLDLAPDTLYGATLTTGIKDLAGNALATSDTWSFKTGSATPRNQEPVLLGSAGNFAILAFNTVTNVNNPGTRVVGDLGISPGAALVGFPPGVINGAKHLGDDIAKQAKADLLVAYNDAAGRLGAAVLPQNLSGLTFTPGLYKNSTSVQISAADLTLDALGDANAVFIFQMGSTLTTSPGTHVVLSGGAKAANVFWAVGTSATLGTNSIFKGTIIVASAITMNTGAALEGRVLARNAAVTLDTNKITAPAP